jgi:hypothetical protein
MADSFTLQHLVLRRASVACGGDEALNRILNVSAEDLRRWMEGKELAPPLVLNQALELANKPKQDCP